MGKFYDVALNVFAIIVCIGVLCLTFNKFSAIYNNETMVFCCNFSSCSDVYYDNVTNKCVLTLTGETYDPVIINESLG